MDIKELDSYANDFKRILNAMIISINKTMDCGLIFPLGELDRRFTLEPSTLNDEDRKIMKDNGIVIRSGFWMNPCDNIIRIDGDEESLLEYAFRELDNDADLFDVVMYSYINLCNTILDFHVNARDIISSHRINIMKSLLDNFFNACLYLVPKGMKIYPILADTIHNIQDRNVLANTADDSLCLNYGGDLEDIINYEGVIHKIPSFVNDERNKPLTSEECDTLVKLYEFQATITHIFKMAHGRTNHLRFKEGHKYNLECRTECFNYHSTIPMTLRCDFVYNESGKYMPMLDTFSIEGETSNSIDNPSYIARLDMAYRYFLDDWNNRECNTFTKIRPID